MLKQTAKAAQDAAKELVKLAINGRVVQVPKGSTLLEAVRASGVYLPTLCYHPEFKAKAVCRMCLVDVEGSKNPVPACYTPAKEGSIIKTDTEELKLFRRSNLQFLLSRHPNECIRCEAAGNCKLQDLVQEEEVKEIWPKSERGSKDHPEHLLHDHSSPSIIRDMTKCIECGLCVDACASQNINAIGFAERGKGMLPVTAFDKPLSETGCISCGQCTLRCPVGALVERPDWHRVLDALDSRNRTTVVQTSPASRVAIGEEFGLPPGAISTGRLINALRELGFDYVFDTNFAADLTILEEANELLARLRGEREGKLPLFTSCCPAWVNYCEIHRPDLLPHLSTSKSPQQMLGAVAKHGPFAKTLHPENDPFVVSIMPCTAKKDEAVRPDMVGDVDAAITTRELAKMIRHRHIAFPSLSNDGEYDNPLGASTGAAAIFGASGGVLEAALRTAADVLGLKDAPLEFKEVRGVDRGVKIAEVKGVGKVAAISSIGAAVDFLKGDEWKKDFIMIEVMTCRGGCLGGGGEPKSDDPRILEKRAKGIYEIDEKKEIRKSHENPAVTAFYKSVQGEPLSEISEKLLHTNYAPRRSGRDMLARFLSAVDRRDGAAAASLMTEDCEWHTNSPLFGDVHGQNGVRSLIDEKLPPLTKLSSQMPLRHRLADPSEGTDVIMPDGQTVHFDIVLDEATGRIASLTRVPGGLD